MTKRFYRALPPGGGDSGAFDRLGGRTWRPHAPRRPRGAGGRGGGRAGRGGGGRGGRRPAPARASPRGGGGPRRRSRGRIFPRPTRMTSGRDGAATTFSRPSAPP